jgi:hypothetical protein
MVAQEFLVLSVGVRIPAGLPHLPFFLQDVFPSAFVCLLLSDGLVIGRTIERIERRGRNVGCIV